MNDQVTQAEWNNTAAAHEVQRKNPHQRLSQFAKSWGAHMEAWQDHIEWRKGVEAKMARVLNGLLPTTESADDIVLEMEELEKQQQAFSASINAAETNVFEHAGEMKDCKERMDVAGARLMLACTESNTDRRKAALILAQAKDDKWASARKAFRDAEYNKLVAGAHLKQLERDRSRIAGQVWSRRSRLDLLAAQLNAVMKGETK